MITLEPLRFLIGRWTSQSGGLSREISYEWLYSRFIQAKSSRREGDRTVLMTLLYVPNAARNQIMFWMLSSDGTWSHGYVELQENGFDLLCDGEMTNGLSISLTAVHRSTGDETRTEQLRNVIVGGQPVSDNTLIEWKRTV